jgi:hypothetical protein
MIDVSKTENTESIRVKIVLWDELSDEEKKSCEELIGNKPFNLSMHEFIITDKCLDKLPDLVRGFLSYHKANLELEKKLVLSFENSSLFKDCVDDDAIPDVPTIFVLHHSVADQIRCKKKIESIFTMRAFW